MSMPRRSGRRPRPVGYLLLPNQVLDLVLPAHIAVGALPRGEFNDAHWHSLAVFCDVVQLLAHDAEQEDVLSLGRRVNQTLIAIRERYGRLRRWGATGPEQTFLRDAINPLDHFFRRQTTHKVRAALLRLDAALAKAEADGTANKPIELNPALLPAAHHH